MGKLSSKKSTKKLDFNKVKFKIGKKLPKNLNETKANFKAKTLILKQQFQADKAGPVSHRNLTIKELLAHLSHHNQSTKLDAITSLKDLLSNNAEYFLSDLNSIFSNVCQLFSDRDYKVRQAVIQFLTTLLQMKELNKETLQPFNQILSAHLSCAMTHIDENIQYSSLQILDIFIHHYPHLVLFSYPQIFENFIEQISKLTLKANKRVLKDDPFKMTSTQMWRLNVLKRLFKLIGLLKNPNEILSAAQKKANTEEATIKFNTTECRFEIYEKNTESIEKRECFKLSKRDKNVKHRSGLGAFLKEYVLVLGPLLIDCWIEAKPEDCNVIETGESLEIMYSVLSIFSLLVEQLNIDLSQILNDLKLNKKATKSIEVQFLSHFPFILSETYSNEKVSSSQVSIKSINLLICKLTAFSVLQLSNERLIVLLQYCLNLFDSTKNENEISNNELVIVLNLSEILFNNFSLPELIKPFLNCLMNYYEKLPSHSTSKMSIFEFFANQFFKNRKLAEYSVYLNRFFANSLKFCIQCEKEKKIDKLSLVLDLIRKLLISHRDLLSPLFQNEFVNLIYAMDFENDEIALESCKKKLFELLEFLPQISNFVINKLAITIISQKVSLTVTNQILGILKMKFEESDKNPEVLKKSDYIVFLLTLINGYTSFHLIETIPDMSSRNNFIYIDDKKFDTHVRLFPHLIEFLVSHKNSETLIDILLSTSLPVFHTLAVFPASTLYASLNLISLVNLESVSYATHIVQLMNKTILSILANINHQNFGKSIQVILMTIRNISQKYPNLFHDINLLMRNFPVVNSSSNYNNHNQVSIMSL